MNGDINSKQPLFIRIIFFVILFSLGFLIKSYFFNAIEKNNKEIIQRKLDSINKTLPFVFEDFVKADSVSLLKDDKLRYNFTLIKVDSSSSKLYVDALEYKMKSQCQNYYETNEGMKLFRDNGIIVSYFYYDINGKYLFDFSIKPNKK